MGTLTRRRNSWSVHFFTFLSEVSNWYNMPEEKEADEQKIELEERKSEDVESEEMKSEDESKPDLKGQKRKKEGAKSVAKSSKATGNKAKKLKVDSEVNSEANGESESDEDDSPVPLLDQSPQVSGTRIRKQVDRLSVNTPVRVETPGRRKNEIVPGRGIKLGASSKIVAQLQHAKQSEMTLLHRLLFERPGTAHEIKKNIREFSGFSFIKTDKEFDSRKHTLAKNAVADIKFICQLLCLEKSGTKETIIERVLDFLLCPTADLKPVKSSKAKSKSLKKDAKSNQSLNDSSSSEVEKQPIDSESQESKEETSLIEQEEPTPKKKTVKKLTTKKTAEKTKKNAEKEKQQSKKVLSEPEGEDEEQSPSSDQEEATNSDKKKSKAGSKKKPTPAGWSAAKERRSRAQGWIWIKKDQSIEQNESLSEKESDLSDQERESSSKKRSKKTISTV